MKISLIVAMATNRAIGLDNKMPWHLSADLKKFKAITMGSPIVMGRKTYESIGRPLPGRSNIIISRNLDYQQTDCLVFNDIKTAIAASSKESEEIFIIGGAELYKATLPLADNLYLTLINQEFTGDTFFPEIDFKAWSEASREDISDDPSVNFSYSFLKLSRTN
ncbi:MAG: dihydrofolate reductase [Methylococcales bacterium]|nr:dihydrofolate reductase [Methylococcales bacterium]